MGLWSVTALVGPICGPILGGVLCDSYGWSVIFLINVPIAALAAVIAWKVLVRGRPSPVTTPFDSTGLGLLVLWVGALQIMLDLGKDRDWFSSALICGLAVVSAIAFCAFIIWELTAEHPIVNLRVFRHRGFSTSMVVFAVSLGGFFATNLLTPLWLQSNLGYTATSAGLASGATGLMAVIAAPIAAWLCTRIDDRIVLFTGVAWLMMTSLLRGIVNTDITLWQVSGILFLVGSAMPAFFMPLMTMSLAAVEPSETADASGLSSFVRTLSGAFATSVVTTTWESSAARNHAELAARSTNLGEAVDRIAAAGLTPQQALALGNNLVDQQALVLATNQMFWLAALAFGLALSLVWLIPPPGRTVDASLAH